MLVRFQKADGNKEPGLFRLTDIQPHFVALVTAGANRQKKFQVVKDDTGTALPAGDTGENEKKAAKSQRAKAYEIEVLEATPTSPVAGCPSVEEMYGDPVNLQYPLGKEDNKFDAEIVGSELARFKKNIETYAQEKSFGIVYGRIAEAALLAGVTVPFDKDDAVDKMLPAELQKRLIAQSKNTGDAGDTHSNDGDGSPGDDGVDASSWLDKAGDTVDGLTFLASLEAVNVFPEFDGVGKTDGDNVADIGDPQNTPTVKRLTGEVRQLESDLQTEKEAREKAEAELAKLKKKLADETRLRKKESARVVKLKKGMGGATALVTGVVSTGTAADDEGDDGGVSAPWAGGGDLAAKVAQK